MSQAFEWAYAARGSALERTSPALKVVAAVAVVVALVVQPHGVPKALQVLGLVALWLASRLGFRALGTLVLAVSPLALMTLVSALVVGDGPVPWAKTVALELQILGVFLALTLLVRTTAPTALAEGLERLFSPLRKWGLPTHEAVLMFTIALRFVPLLLVEFQAVSRAQLARAGASRGPWAKVAALPALLVPLFVLSILRAQALAEAMESRCYGGAEGRTPVAVHRWTGADRALAAVTFVNLVASVTLAFVPGPGAGSILQ